MKISKSILLGVTALFFVFIKPAESKIPEFLVDVAEVEKILVGKQFQELQESNIMTRTDGVSLAARAVIEDIRNEVRKYQLNKVGQSAANASIEGILECIRLIYYCAFEDSKTIEAAVDLVRAGKIESALDIIKRRFINDKNIIFMAGVPAQVDQGIALAISGDLAMPKLKKSIHSIQKAGHVILEIIRLSNLMADAGIKNGGNAAEASLNSVNNVIETGFMSVFKNLRDAVQHVLEGTYLASSNTNDQVDLAAGVINSLKTESVTNNSKALSVIAKLENSLRSFTNDSTEKRVINAAYGIFEGLKSTIHEIGSATDIAKNALLEAENLAYENPEAAIQVISKGIKEAYDKIKSGAAYAFLAFGFAGHTLDKSVSDKFVLDVVELELGTATSYEDLQLAERVAIIGIENGKSTLKQGISTALEMCDVSALSLFQDYTDGGENALEVLKAFSTK